MATVMLSMYHSNLLPSSCEHKYLLYLGFKPDAPLRTMSKCLTQKQQSRQNKSNRRFTVLAVTKGSAKSSQSDEKIPSWAKPDSDEPPPWASEERGQGASQQTIEIPFFVYLLASAVTAIAAIGSAFEYVNQKPVFGILYPDSAFYTPLLGFFAITGIPTSAFLWYKSVEAANKAAEEQDRRDGFL